MPTEPISEEDLAHESGEWEYWEDFPNDASNKLRHFDFSKTICIKELKAKLKTSTNDLEDAEQSDFTSDEDAFHGFKKFFKTKHEAIAFALDRINDFAVADEDYIRTYDDDDVIDVEDIVGDVIAMKENAEKDI